MVVPVSTTRTGAWLLVTGLALGLGACAGGSASADAGAPLRGTADGRAAPGGVGAAAKPAPPEEASYLFYVASESEDEVTLLRFSPTAGLSKEKVISVGWLPAEIEAPHGLFVDPDGRHWYLTLGHGFPNGRLVKYETGADTMVQDVELGLFPATVSVSGSVALAVNSNFHGDHEPSTVSIVETETMIEIDQVETCTMPHGSRFTTDGTRHYSACMMDDRLVEIDAGGLVVARTLDLDDGHGSHDGSQATCSPTWAAPSTDGQHVYVPCNRGNRILEVDVATWTVSRTIDAPGAPYNLAVAGSRLLATLKGDDALAVWDLRSGALVARVPSVQQVTHGVIVTPDQRYAMVTVEGIGGQPGIVEVVDLESYERVAVAEVGKQAGGIAFWKTEVR